MCGFDHLINISLLNIYIYIHLVRFRIDYGSVCNSNATINILKIIKIIHNRHDNSSPISSIIFTLENHLIAIVEFNYLPII